MLAKEVVFIALLPILLLVVLLFVVKLPLIKAAPIAFAATTLTALIFWDISWFSLSGALGKGLLLSLDIALIVFGAIFFLTYLQEIGALRNLQENLKSLSPDRRVQAILLTWLLGGFIEGVAGFGTPAVTVAPLLVGIGFTPMTAMTVALLANSTAVTFGAVGTPIRIGYAGLEAASVPAKAAALSFLPGLLIPVMILGFVVLSESQVGSRSRAFREGLPWALFAGFAFLIPFTLFAQLGPEFPSLFGATLGLMFAVISLRFGFLVPRISDQAMRPKPSVNWLSLARAFSPYGLLMVLLLLGKPLFDPLSIRVDLGNGLSHSLQSFNPGFAFLTTILLLALFKKQNPVTLFQMGKSTLAPLSKAVVSIFFVSSMTYVMIVSGILESLAQVMMTPALSLYSAFIGAFGSFLAGSATVSNLLFGELQARAAEDLGLAVPWILALQLFGAAAGNMIALPNILAVQAAVATEGVESQLIYRLVGPCIIYLIAASLMSLVFL